MPIEYNPDKLKAFAEKKIAAEKYPHDYHMFRTFECDTCGKVPFVLVIEHHTGSKKGDFKGIIHGICQVCNTAKKLFSFTGSHRKQERAAKVTCSCKLDQFYVAMDERYEGDEGVMGFFDEGVVVGQSANCGQLHTFVYTD